MLFAAAALPQPERKESAASDRPSPTANRGASLKERLAAAKSARVLTGILDVELESTLEEAHRKLDNLTDPARPWQKQKGHRQSLKVIWPLKETDFSSVYVKTDAKGRIEYITGFLREGQEMAFDKIGETKKAPILTESAVLWDVIRPKRKPMRVRATGTNYKASVITLFVVPSRRTTN